MTTVLGFCFAAALMAVAAICVYNLQSWLERWDHDRHFEDQHRQHAAVLIAAERRPRLGESRCANGSGGVRIGNLMSPMTRRLASRWTKLG